MQVSLIRKESISTITLPEKVHGQYWLSIFAPNRSIQNAISIEGIGGEWKIKSNKNAQLLSKSRQPIKEVAFTPNTFHDVKLKDDPDVAVIYVEQITKDRQTFRCYTVSDICDLTIGRGPENDICFAAKYVSQKHAVLRYRGSRWYISDLESTNGTYVNDQAAGDLQALQPGDVLYIMGLKLIIGSNYIALNNPDGLVEVKSKYLRKKESQIPAAMEDEDEDLEKSDYFYRSPRFMREVKPVVVRVDTPPNDQIGDEMPVMLLIGPSVTMGMASIATGTFTIVNAVSNGNIRSAIPSAIMSFSMLLGTMLWPILSKRYEKRRRRKKEALRQAKYSKYLDEIREEISDETKKQSEILHENAITAEQCREKIEQTDRTLWERSETQSDFLTFRLGLGNRPLSIDLRYQERKFSLDDDNLMENMYELCESEKELHDVPITICLANNAIAGFIGDRASVMAAMRRLITQLTAFYGYDEVKCVFIYDPQRDADMQFVKWLPHVWDSQKNYRLIATNSVELKEISAFLEREIETRLELPDERRKDISPYYLIFALDRDLSNRAEVLRQIYNAKKDIHFSVVTCFDELKNLPKECSTVIEIQPSTGKIFDKNDTSGSFVAFSPDSDSDSNMLPLARHLANLELDIASTAFKLPQMLTFLEMYGVGKIEHLNALSRWQENDPTKSLEAAVGVNTLGDRFMLDLHQSFHGPHGLIAGMTGSGKSEFVMTYILSLAVNYHPHEVSFILIDYKGGGMAKTFEKLPHTAGIITNLDGNAIKRSLLSIESELKRRETLFSSTATKLGTSNLDIYKYQKLYREKRVNEPLPHLFIISDEFAELKTQQPEFMEHLVSAARIGRSLGVHLILATQKPAGVVDDQIWSNSKFRVCLKVQDRADSMDMLKRPDAAELTTTGRFYLQVGYNELFELGQSAWAGAPYYPSDQAVVERDTSISVIDMTGHPIKQLKLDKHGGAKAEKQIDEITKYLATLAAEANAIAKPLWLPPIPEHIMMEDVRATYHLDAASRFVLNPLIGVYDDPSHQRQGPLTLPLTEDGNAIIYGAAGNGKTSFLNALIYSLITEHTPEEVNLYILDFASETLSAFSKAPHVGEVIFSSEAEKVSNLFKMLLSEVGRRKKLFSQFGGEFQGYINNSGNTMPNIVVILHNYSAFSELFEEKEEALSFLSREGRKYGIYFVLSALATGAVRFRLLQNFKQLLTLQLNDENEYSTVVGKTEGLTPAKCKGRGLVRLNNAVYEFQTAFMTKDAIPTNYLKSSCESMRSVWNGPVAKRIPILPEHVDVDFVRGYYDTTKPLNVPIGVEASSLNIHYYSFASSCITLLLSASTETDSVATAIVNLISSSGHQITVFDTKAKLLCEKNALLHHIDSASGARVALHELVLKALERNHAIAEAKQNGGDIPSFEQNIILINSLSDLLANGDEEDVSALKVFLEKLSEEYNMFFIVAESAKNLTAFTFEKWYKKHISPTDCIWVGSGFSDQYQMKASKQTPELRDELGSDFGFSLKHGIPVKVKILRNYEEED